MNQSHKREGEGFTACASFGKGNLKAYNCMSILNSSLEALFSVWAGMAWLSRQYEHEQKGETPLLLAWVELCKCKVERGWSL